jgi:hypothetical protein
MSDDDTRPIEPGPEATSSPPESHVNDAPAPPPGAAPPFGSGGYPAYAMPVGGYPAYAVAQRPRFVDQVLGMRAVIAVAIACLIIGGLSGFLLGRTTAGNNDRFGPGPGVFPGFQHRGALPGGPQGFPTQKP